jgi:hypothetical protein
VHRDIACFSSRFIAYGATSTCIVRAGGA